MYYRVIFTTINGGPAVYGAPLGRGTEFVGEIVRKYRIRDLRIVRIIDSCPVELRRNAYIMGIHLAERALQCPHFESTDVCRVFIPDGFLSRYIIMKEEIGYANPLMKWLRIPETVVISPAVDEDSLWSDWESAGFPVFWGCSPEDTSESSGEVRNYDMEVLDHHQGLRIVIFSPKVEALIRDILNQRIREEGSRGVFTVDLVRDY